MAPRASELGNQKEKKKKRNTADLFIFTPLVRFWNQRPWDTSASTPGFLAAGNLAWSQPPNQKSTLIPAVRPAGTGQTFRDRFHSAGNRSRARECALGFSLPFFSSFPCLMAAVE